MGRAVFILAILCVVAWGVPSQAAEVWDLAKDLSIANGNPNGAWTYGYFNTGAQDFTVYDAAFDLSPNWIQWRMSSGEEFGYVLRNISGGVIAGIYEPDTCVIHPGMQQSVVNRWTAPRAMNLQVQGSFRARAGGDQDVHVYHNGAPLFDEVISGVYGSPPSYADGFGDPVKTFSAFLSVEANDTIDFVIGVGPDGAWTSGITSVDARLSELDSSLGFVSGKVTGNVAGHPGISGARVESADGSVSTTTASDGSYWIMLPADSYTVKVSHAWVKPGQATVEVAAGQTTTQDFDLNPRDGVTYYVDGTNGQDTNDGLTPGTAWRTITNGDAQGKLIGGDTVVVAAGTYPQPDWLGLHFINCSGNPVSGPIAYNAAGGRVLIDQTATPRSETGVSIGILLDTSFTTVNGFEVIGASRGIYSNDGKRDNTIANCVVHNLRTVNPGDLTLAGACFGIVNSVSVNNVNHNNLVYDIGDPSLPNLSACIASPISTNLKLYNNTLIGAQYGIHGWEGGVQHVFQNNIVADATSAAISGYYAGVSGFVHMNNLFFDNRADFGWLATPGNMEFSGPDPLFTDAGSGDFTLQSLSPAINIGLDVGLPFVGPAPDLGAFETSVTAPAGFITGVVTANVAGHPPVTRATLSESSGRALGTSGSDGTYLFPVFAGTYTVTAARQGFAAQTAAPVKVGTGETVTLNFDLDLVPGKTYYVSASGGNDSNDGKSPSTAWATINRGDVLGVLAPGDTVRVLAGYYLFVDDIDTGYQGVTLARCHGEQAAPIIYKADTTDGPVVIDQSSVIPGYNWDSYGFLVDVDGVTLDGFEITGCQWGVYFRPGRRFNTIANCRIYGLTEPQPGAVDDTGRSAGIYLPSGTASTLIHHNTIYNVGQPAALGDLTACILATNVKDLAINNNTLLQSNRGIHAVGGENHSIHNNILADMRSYALCYNSLPAGLNHSYNVFSGNASNYGGLVLAGLAESNLDPMFVDPYGWPPDYHLQSGSSLINLGLDVGLPFEGPAPDMGAFETDALTPCPFGYVAGVVRSSRTLVPIAGARVQIEGTTEAAITGSDGAYALWAAPGTQTIGVLAAGFAAKQETASVAAGTTTQLDFSLDAIASKTWDLAADFSIEKGNPNGDWSYGRGEFVLWPETLFAAEYNRAIWWEEAYQGSTGFIFKLMQDVPQLAAGQYVEPGQIIMYPGTGERSVARWTAPLNGTITINAKFSGQNYFPTNTDVHVAHNGVDLFFADINGFAGTLPDRLDVFGTSPVQVYQGFVDVVAGDVIDFSVGYGANNNNYSDHTGVAVTIAGPDTSVATVTSLADLQGLPEGKLVAVTGDQVVTVASGTLVDGSCYVEDPERLCGMKIVLEPGVPAVALGDRIQFAGSIGIDSNDEPFVEVTSVTSKSSGTPLRPLGMANRTITAASGGLLVTVWGTVADKAADGSYVVIDDGSGAATKVALTGLSAPLTKTLNKGGYVGITGVVAVDDDGAGLVVRPRRDADLAIY